MALENILSQEIVQKLGWTLLHFIWQAAAVALLLTILLALLRKAAANVRYIVACAALGLIVLLPIVTIQLVPVSTPQPIAGTEPAPAPVILPAQEIREIPIVEMTVPEGPVQHENAGTAFNASWKQRAADLLEPALPYLVSAWLLGVFGLSLWHLGGWAQLQRLRKKMVRQVDESLYTKLRRLSERLRVKRAVQLAESALVQVPTVVGWLRPVILLPASALTGLTTEQLESLLAHELAHIRRHDYLINMLQTIVETLGFYHPAVWWVSHKIRIERENCCDDLAVSISGDRIRYARALTSMEEIRGRHGSLAVAAAGGNLFGRIRRLVGKDSTEPSRTSWIPSAITILLIAIIAIPTTLALTAKSESAEPEQLNEILEKFSDGITADKSGNNSKSVRESVEKYIAAALAGEDEKAAEYTYPGTAVTAQTNDMREILKGQDIKIVAACIGEWNSLAISSVIQADHGRTGSIVFELKKVILEKKVLWLIDEIDLNAIDSIGEQIHYFIKVYPDAKMIIINPDTYTNKQTEVKVESGEGSIEGKIVDVETGKGIAGIRLVAVPNSSPESNERSACTSAEDGSFAIGGLQSGEYLLRGDFPSVDVDVVSGRSTNDVLIGVDRRTATAAPKETTAELQSNGQIIIGMRVIELPADAMKDVFEPNESLSSGLLVRQGHEIAGRLLTLSKEQKDAKLMAAPQMLLNNNSNGTIAMIKEEFFVLNYEPIEGEPGKFAPQIQPLEIGWKFNIKAKILENGEKVHIELATRQQEPGFETRQYRPGYDYQIPVRPEIFVTEATAKNGEPFVISRLRHGETAYCLIVTPSAILPERQPEPLLGKNCRNLTIFKI